MVWRAAWRGQMHTIAVTALRGRLFSSRLWTLLKLMFLGTERTFWHRSFTYRLYTSMTQGPKITLIQSDSTFSHFSRLPLPLEDFCYFFFLFFVVPSGTFSWLIGCICRSCSSGYLQLFLKCFHPIKLVLFLSWRVLFGFSSSLTRFFNLAIYSSCLPSHFGHLVSIRLPWRRSASITNSMLYRCVLFVTAHAPINPGPITFAFTDGWRLVSIAISLILIRCNPERVILFRF